MSRFVPVPNPEPRDYPNLTNVWPEVADEGLVSLYVNGTSCKATWLDAVELAQALLEAASKSAQNIGVGTALFDAVAKTYAAEIGHQERTGQWT